MCIRVLLIVQQRNITLVTRINFRARLFKYCTMATHGTFNPNKEPWTAYTERLHHYFVANEVKSDEKKCAILLSVCGPDTYTTIRSVVDAEALASTNYEDLIKHLQRHYDPKPSFIIQHFKFYNRTRAAGETVTFCGISTPNC